MERREHATAAVESTSAEAGVLSDSELWTQVVQGSVAAFEETVRRHQTVVTAVAFALCGDQTISEDIAQDAFLAAWQTSASLNDRGKLRPWLCGIARNLTRNSWRKQTRSAASAVDLNSIAEPWQDQPNSADRAAEREEQDLVWRTLEAIPETYREPLVLFYREDQSVGVVAQTLDLSEDTVRQRLSRGREMLRHQVTGLIEGTLRRTRPTTAFTMAVMAGLTAATTGSKVAAGTATAIAATGTVTAGATKAGSSVLAAGAAAGLAGGITGTAAGLAGGWLGSWIPAQLAPTNRERLLLLKVGRRILIVSIGMMIVLLAIIAFVSKHPHWNSYYLAMLLGWMVGYQSYLGAEILFQIRAVRRIRAETPFETDPNMSPTAVAAKRIQSRIVSRYTGRVYVSPRMLLGRPLIHFNVSDPQFSDSSGHESRVAKGWIAVGDRADGWLLAIGGRARGLIAIGGATVGVISLGGMAIGIVAVGGLGAGILSLGGLGLGVIAAGGLGLGWQAMGGLAIGWNFAAGGGAVAVGTAYGGLAVARDVAVGGAAYAERVNLPADRLYAEGHWMARALSWQISHNAVYTCTLIGAVLLLNIVVLRAMYCRRQMTETVS